MSCKQIRVALVSGYDSFNLFLVSKLKKALTILFLSFYGCGTLFLPLGDFSAISDLPGMYRHCRDTEDRDLTVFEFFTEHVSGLGAMIEGIEHDDEPEESDDKPHAPVSFHFQQTISYEMQVYKVVIDKPVIAAAPIIHCPIEDTYTSTYTAFIFRPPVC